MASNNSSDKWSVRIPFLPGYITYNELAQELRLPPTRVFIPKNSNNNNTRYAWINDFQDEEDANEFVRQWSGAEILGSRIKCIVSSSRRHETNSSYTSQESRIPVNQPLKKPRLRQKNYDLSNKSSSTMTTNPNVHYFNKNQNGFQHEQRSNLPSTRNFLENSDTQNRRPLNRKMYTNSKYRLTYATEEDGTKKEQNVESDDASSTTSDSCLSINSLHSIGSDQSTNTKSKRCQYGVKCFNVDCTSDHPNGWNPCMDGEKCDDYDCTATHPFERKAKCRDGNRCKAKNCRNLHPKTRSVECPLRARCEQWNCSKLHPGTRPQPCLNQKNCTNLSCLCLHPPERATLLCLLGVDCRDLSCRFNHPPERSPQCDQPDTCSNCNCIRLHHSQWNPSEINEIQKDRKRDLKTFDDRMKNRQKAQLPILSCRQDFCQRLQHERVLIVTAETGSGKSTQLPQYAAEHFGSLVVCTQPRVVAALSLARRVAEEYDGKSPGESIGYQCGNATRVPGRDIMYMTDAALIRESQRDPSLKHVRVLIVDEAHERSLNTDIVIGISKLLLKQRPNDFHVVIASATIDPTRFLQFFDRPSSLPLQVEGRVFPVIKSEKPPPSNCSDQQLITTHIVPVILELYPQHKGHTLVFLPGQGEIERALKIFRSKLPDDCIAFPLYGSQSPEDQEKVIKFNEVDKRMVVFCTNVAETSLTIPNIRLVIDSGLAKEARYDVKRRLTVIETVRISRSSADQRMGRAGRTASGHCIRLYEDKELTRSNIEPEILRSSLDLILLQLIRLKFDPRTFSFMDQPQSDTIQHSLDLLTQLNCIEEQTITKRGELFTELGLDPRLSAFIVDIYTENKNLLDQAVAIVTILSAPGSVFFMGGTTQEEKQEAKERVAVEARNYKSDLFHFYSVYDRWKNAGGQNIQGKCSKCNKFIKSCICRVRHSNENSLNNKVLQHVDASCETIIKQIKNTFWLQPGHETSKDAINIIGNCLAKLFPEQCGYLLVPQLPIEGVRLISTDIRANITNTSVFMQKLQKDSDRALYQHFVAMTITQLPSGRYITERLHPILKSDIIAQSSIQNLMTLNNIGWELAHQLRLKLNTFKSELWAKWFVYHYDRSQCRFFIWGLETDKSTIVSIVRSSYDEVLKKLSDAYELFDCGPIKANFQSGLVCTHINTMPDALKLHLQNVPCQTINTLKDWIKKIIDIEWNEIKAHGFYNSKRDIEKKNVFLIFKNEDTFRRALLKIPSYHVVVEEDGFGRYRDSEKESWARELVIQTPSNVIVNDIIDRYGADIIMRCVQTNKKAQTESFIKLNTLPNTTNETFLRQCLRNCNGPIPRSVYVGRTKNNASGWAKITFHNDEERDRAAAIYNSQLCNNIFLITILGKSGLKQKPVRTSVTKNDDPFARNNRSSFLSKNIFHLTTISREAALQIFSSHTYSWIVDSSATVTISHIDLYPKFEEIINGICQRFDVQVKCKHMSNLNKCRCVFSNGNPQKTSLAAFMLAQTFAPINIRLNTELQKQLFRELEDVGEIQKWAKELDLAINPNKYWTNIEILGPQTSQGRLMRQIADYSESFNERFYEFELSATVATFFGQQKSASVKLQQIASKWSTKACSIAFNRKTATITLIGKPNVSSMDLKACESEVLQLLNELTATTDDLENDVDEEEDDDDNGTIRFGTERQERRCVFCQQKSSISTSFFRICGHTYCRCTARALATSHTFPLQCKACQSNIHIRDIQIIFNNNEQLYLSLRKSSIQHYLITNHQDDDRVFCPNDECDGLIRLNNSYQICLTCGQNVCPRCQVIDDELHIGRTCDQVAEEKKHHPFLSQVFSAAKKFVQNNWPFDPLVRPVGQMYENPYLRKEYQALLRFYKANEILGHSSPPDLAKGFFAYHGSPAESIVPICQNGFDPNRRLNQVHGPGEYFGISAIISDTYTKKAGNHTGFNQMIIAFILRCTQITKIDHFCYVVNNPIDWTYAFNLPVLIVTYGQAVHRQLSPFPTEIPYYSDIESLWMSPFQWHWQQHNRQFHSYNDTMNEILEKVYQHWKLYDGPTEIETPLLSSCLTDTSDVYKFDFQRNKQTNTRTSYSRSIERRLVRTLSDNRHWFYCNEDDTWVRHEQMAEKQIEQAFQSYRTGQGSFIADIQFSGHSEIYQFNFLKGQQRNKSVAKMLSIKRE